MSFQIEDIAQLLKIAAGVVGHPALTHGTLKDAQAQIKAFIADKYALQDPEILTPLDQILQYGAAAQVPATALGVQFDPSKYVDPPTEDAGEPEQPIDQLPPPEEEVEPVPEFVVPTHPPAVEEPEHGSVPEKPVE